MGWNASWQADGIYNVEANEVGLTRSVQVIGGVTGFKLDIGWYVGGGLVWNTDDIASEAGGYTAVQAGGQLELAGVGAGLSGQGSRADEIDRELRANIFWRTGIEYDARPWALSVSLDGNLGPGNVHGLDGHLMAGPGITEVTPYTWRWR